MNLFNDNLFTGFAHVDTIEGTLKGEHESNIDFNASIGCMLNLHHNVESNPQDEKELLSKRMMGDWMHGNNIGMTMSMEMMRFPSEEDDDEDDDEFGVHGASLPALAFPTSLPELIASNTTDVCQELLREPERKKPGRKPKGIESDPLPDHILNNRSDPAAPLDKKEKRKLKNREAADVSRKRMRERGQLLEQISNKLKSENELLIKHIQQMEMELGIAHSK